MKNLLFIYFIVVFTITAKTTAQGYYYELKFSGLNELPNSVIKATNLSKQISVTLQGSDILLLDYLVFGFEKIHSFNEKLIIFTNPVDKTVFFSFVNSEQGQVIIQLYSLTGKLLCRDIALLAEGNYQYSISNTGPGIHLLVVKTSSGSYSGMIVSSGSNTEPVKLEQIQQSETEELKQQTAMYSKSSEVVRLHFSEGDTLKLDASATGYTRQALYLTPVANKTISFQLTRIVEVLNPITGRIWMDRNLGAKQIAIAEYDSDAFGDFFQWGRDTDGHEKPQSAVSSVLSNIAQPLNSNFIISNTSGKYDWLTNSNDNLWQGTEGANNPCPEGYRIPTEAEWIEEMATWSPKNAVGAFASPLRLVKADRRNYFDGNFTSFIGAYWTSTVYDENARSVAIDPWMALTTGSARASGCCIRCIKINQ